MNRPLRLSALVAFAAVLFAAPAFAQKTSTPVPVVELEKAAKTAVHVYYHCPIGSKQCVTAFQVPDGMRLVVESVMGTLTAVTSGLNALIIETTLNGTFQGAVWLWGQTHFENSAGTYTITPIASSVRLYSDTTPEIGQRGLATVSSADNISLFGYLVKK